MNTVKPAAGAAAQTRGAAPSSPLRPGSGAAVSVAGGGVGMPSMTWEDGLSALGNLSVQNLAQVCVCARARVCVCACDGWCLCTWILVRGKTWQLRKSRDYCSRSLLKAACACTSVCVCARACARACVVKKRARISAAVCRFLPPRFYASSFVDERFGGRAS